MTTSVGRFKINSKADNNSDAFVTVTEFAGKGGADVGDDLVVLYSHLEYAFKRIAALVASPVNSSLGKSSGDGGDVGSGRDKPKPLDIVSNEILLSCLRNSGKVAVMASEEDDAPVWITDDGPFVVSSSGREGNAKLVAEWQ
ncbi:fructose-1,6-bisphosphatase, chloroplastic [Helianthus annuus]|uniref:fructose-1,6-bisphosphatase, chloroplastic n=1 Tax=Helianthus annuus TaxID=4232 RepID=UPI00165303B1|nr:fructose-1,6-bisphosphatase, chloroplastic [Helianthus annuus]